MTRNILLLLATLSICFVLAEVALRLLTPFPIHSEKNKAFDDRLLHVLNTRLNDVDERGFRNQGIPERVDVVTIGDSHTYGETVFWDESWPYQLARFTGKSVYNLGVGAYGVLQYYELFTRALEFQPKHVLIGLYIVNDLAGNACAVLSLPYWQGISEELGLRSEFCGDMLPTMGEKTMDTFASALQDMRRASAVHSAYKYIRYEYLGWDRPKESYTITNGTISLSVSKKIVDQQGKNTDLNKREIVDMFFNSNILFDRIIEAANDNDVNLGILFIPSRKRVYYSWAIREGVDIPEAIVSTVENELTIRNKYEKFFNERGVIVVDAVEDVLAALDRDLGGGEPLYKKRNSHPLAAGYEAYARAAMKLVKQ